METELIVLEDFKRTGILSDADRSGLMRAAGLLKNGGLVAFPTETVYGLGGDALRKEASQRIYAAKGRPSDNPLIVHISDISQIYPLIDKMPEAAAKLAESFWPGPLTMVFRKSGLVPYETTGGLDTVAVRFPVHPAARALIGYSGTAVAAPSANLSGRPSTTSAEHCIEDLTGRVDAIVDGGSCAIGLESTILDVSGDRPVLLRPGAVTVEMIKEVLGEGIDEDAAVRGPLEEGVRPRAPGMKYRHYAPKAPMVLVAEKHGGSVAGAIAELIGQHRQEGMRCAVLCSDECIRELEQMRPSLPEGTVIKSSGSRSDRDMMAHVLFERLREMDAEEVDFIAAEGCSEDQLGKAVMNRMQKAAAWQVLYV